MMEQRMMETSLGLEVAVPVMMPVRAVSRGSLAVGLLAAGGLWVAPTRPLFITAWVLLFAWACLRATLESRERGLARVPVLPLVAGVLTTGLALWGTPSQPLAALGAAVAAGVMPFHLWLEGLRRRLQHSEFLLLLICQPGVVWLHRFVEGNPTALQGGLGGTLLVLFVVSALLQTGLGMVRKEPARALSAITLSQSCLVMAGAFCGHVGWQAARALLIAMVAGTLVLMTIVGMLRDEYGIERLAVDNGLADVAPDLHRLFLAMGWLFVGLPGGLGYFAEDLLFHSLLERSSLATGGFLIATGLNAVAFYRVYLGLFCGRPRSGLRAPVSTPAHRRRVGLLTGVTALVILGGVAPALFL
jgi:NADH:ubiquinone oxidoreductase subunit 4 (subunit M)